MLQYKLSIRSTILLFLITLLNQFSYATHFSNATITQSYELQNNELQHETQRQQEQQKQMQPSIDVRLPTSQEQDAQIHTTTQQEAPCFVIQQINLTGDSASQFQFALEYAIQQSHFQAGKCLGSQSINQLMTYAQNAIIDKGYTTTRILAAPQDLNSGYLTLTVLPGRVHQIRIDTSNQQTTHANRIANFQNELPIQSGDILNLRKIEQGLENLKRIPTVETDIQIVPAQAANESDIIIIWRQRTIPYRVSIGLNDSGSKNTGKYQGNITLSADNPLGLSDMAYISISRDLGHKTRLTDAYGAKTNSSSRSYALHYSVPIGKWLWSFNQQYYRYHQAVAGLNEIYDYNGKSWSQDIGFSYLLYRDARRKTYLGSKLWQKRIQSYINDTEITVQRRKTAGWSIHLNHKEYIGKTTLDIALSYKRGTGMNNSLPAPEQTFGQGTARMKVLTADILLNQPFQLDSQHLTYESRLYLQWNGTPLTPLDRLSIGGRYSVRGFDGELTLSAERGGYWQNTLTWFYQPNHQLYLGIDTGRVAGPSAQYLLGHSLTGFTLGLKGNLLKGNLSYDLFLGKPIHRPTYFQTPKTTYGFNLLYQI